MVSSLFPIQVPRLCRVRSADPDPLQDLFPLDADGFRVERRRAQRANTPSMGELIEASALRDRGSLVLLGEPGAGKTSLLRVLTADCIVDEVPRTLDQADCLWVHAAELSDGSYEDLLGRELALLPHADAERAAAGGMDDATSAQRLTVVIDQLDECPILERLPRLLRRTLKGRNLAGLRVLIACRTASFKQALVDVLKDHLGACMLVDLAPLSRSDAVALADSAGLSGVSGAELIKSVVAAKAGPLASVPLTLELLVRTYRDENKLDGHALDLFARGTRLLAAEHDTQRTNSAPAVTTVEQRLATAGRLAAWMLLSGRRSLWLGGGHPETPHHLDLSVELAVGGTEATGPGLTFDVSRVVVSETLATGLFAAAGRYRMQFRHSSLSAYLAARYLVRRGTRASQLADMFLVRSPDGVGASIPAPLRETAAWIVALSPNETTWLADADPASLVAHSALVRSPRIRELIVERLLERADEVELGDSRYYFTRWDLDHPTLDTQLAHALAAEPEQAGVSFPHRARVRVALRLAQDCPSPALTTALLRIANDARWPSYERRVAAFVAMDCDAASAAPALRELLIGLPVAGAGVAGDPGHELRGMLLSLLWPKFLTVEELLSVLVAPPERELGDDYARFWEHMPEGCAEDELSPLLSWLEQVWPAETETPAVTCPDKPELSKPSVRIDLSSPHGPGRVLDATLAQVMRSLDPHTNIAAVARLVVRRFAEHDKVLVPERLERDGASESNSATELRRLLADALILESVRQLQEPSFAAWLIISGWERPARIRLFADDEGPRPYWEHLVDSRDFPWALAMAIDAHQRGAAPIADAYAYLAAHVFDPHDEALFQLAYENQDSPVWPHLRHHYDPVLLNSETALRMRKAFKFDQPQHWEHSGQLTKAQRAALHSMAAGESEVFAGFLHNLRFDPATGRATAMHSADPTGWPGMAILDAAERESLLTYAIKFLNNEHDHAGDWLGHRSDQRSWAGHQTLVWLHAQRRLGDLPCSVWHSWSGAVLGEVSAGADEEAETEIRRLAARHAPGRFAQCLTQLVSRAVEQGTHVFRLEMIDPSWNDEVASAMAVLTEDIYATLLAAGRGNDDADDASEPDTYQNAAQIWSTLLTSLARSGREPSLQLAQRALREGATSPSESGRDTAVRAALALLYTDAQHWWPEIHQLVTHAPPFSEQLARAASQSHVRHHIDPALAERELAEVYEWLDPMVGTEEPVYQAGSGFVGPSESIRDWWASLPQAIASKATVAAVLTTRALVDRHPERLHLQAALFASRTRAAAAARAETPLEHVIAVLADPDRRIVRNSGDLLDVMMSVLEQIKEDIPAHGELLWDRVPTPQVGASSPGTSKNSYTWRPKPEAALCAYLDHELRIRLRGQRMVVNREVMILPTDAYGAGKRVDVLAEVHTLGEQRLGTEESTALRLVIEVKGAWNEDLLESQESQLVDSYMKRLGADVGIYVVGWYPLPHWTYKERRKLDAAAHEDALARGTLETQAAQLRTTRHVEVRPVIIEVPRPSKDG
jgi:hypothetical protein